MVLIFFFFLLLWQQGRDYWPWSTEYYWPGCTVRTVPSFLYVCGHDQLLPGRPPASEQGRLPALFQQNKWVSAQLVGWFLTSIASKKNVKQKLTTYRHPTSWYYLSISMFDKQLTHLITLSKFSKLFVGCCQIIWSLYHICWCQDQTQVRTTEPAGPSSY